MSSIKKRLTVAFQLSSVSRFSRDYMQKPESVLEHIGFCSFYAMLLASDLEESGYNIDYKRLMRAVAIHDLDESILGDIPRTTKYFSESVRAGIGDIERQTIERLESWLQTSLLESWVGAKEDLEGTILKIADIAAVVYKNWTEVELLGNRSFLRVCLETNNFLSSFDLAGSHLPQSLQQEISDTRSLNAEILSKHHVEENDKIFLTLLKGE
jgi:5'-deoxynucleotidase YfbR-like HD superfamily hydrolase